MFDYGFRAPAAGCYGVANGHGPSPSQQEVFILQSINWNRMELTTTLPLESFTYHVDSSCFILLPFLHIPLRWKSLDKDQTIIKSDEGKMDSS